MTINQTKNPIRIGRRADHQGPRSGASALAPDLEKYATEHNNNDKNRLIRNEKQLNISTYNVRTLQSAHQIPELIATAIKYHIDVINVQEHRLFHDDSNIKQHDFGKGWTFISVSALKNTVNATSGGVGILLSPHAMKSLKSVEKITSRIIHATFDGNPAPNIVSCYSPTNTAEKQE
uniref:uncharacterized protein LOC120346978 n=1 Tax=Styela clava TaxID=7725 RepID=UPI001939F1D7|nr:uncharacterized protein LOC120346978 [Styela clava]